MSSKTSLRPHLTTPTRPHHGFPVAFGFTSVLIVITGLVLLARLLRTHPLTSIQPDSTGPGA